MDAEIEKLDTSTQSHIRSTQILTSLPQIVSELLQNALDAGATSVEISIDAQEWLCWVKDNGHGIGKNNLDSIGRDGYAGRYSTSKSYAQNLMNAESTFGFRGEVLASAADIGCLEISSRISQSKETWATIVKGAKRLYFGPAIRWRRETPGTVVCVRDAFYNLPVRRNSHPSPAKTWDLVRQEAERYALVFPEVSFSVEDLHQSKQVAPGEKLLRIPKAQSTLAAFRRLYGRALAENVEEISASIETLRMDGFISLASSGSRSYQYIFINRRPTERNELHRAVDSWFSQSTFGRMALNEAGEQDLPGSAEKRPVYCLNIRIPPSDIDNCLEPSKSTVHFKVRLWHWSEVQELTDSGQDQSSVFSFLYSIVHGFLEKHGFLSRARLSMDRARILPVKADVPRKRRRADSADDSGFMEGDVFGQPSSSDHPTSIHRRESTPSKLVVSIGGENEPFTWIDPNTGETFIIDPRTGNSLKQRTHFGGRDAEDTQNYFAYGTTDRRSMKRRDADTATGPTADIPDWLSLAGQMNEAYPRAEKRLNVPSAGLVPVIQLKARLASPEGTRPCEAGFKSRSEQISRQQLLHARVIGQVDRKFVGCVVNPQSGTPSLISESANNRSTSAETLILVDQHAADERIRVEGFLGPLCLGFLYSRSGGTDPKEATPITRFTPPYPILLARHEASLLKGNAGIRDLLRCWGISLQDDPAKGSDRDSSIGSNGDFEQVFVTSIPEVLNDKLRQNNELQALFKGTLGEIQSGTLLIDTLPIPSRQALASKHGWLPALRWCPRSLVELINSKACRGAIMFNDELSREQCERLISQLALTAFPFQCAHGRFVSTPLFVDLHHS
ncbi:hypothetical protein FA13DRAFT_1376732 [Coprinellus micaceus]|uniref:MutL C-terminal dimerisation domain-containing protein n=1 Tax=Coprinellus micaceus TaxID=71717 RepID=A0A4Y7TNJ0_COPMI|nr:hypothetical protein FA13DRAFT_1376732 [Coprinellus micaceus]